MFVISIRIIILNWVIMEKKQYESGKDTYLSL